jgi:hypothetical protein
MYVRDAEQIGKLGYLVHLSCLDIYQRFAKLILAKSLARHRPQERLNYVFRANRQRPEML